MNHYIHSIPGRLRLKSPRIKNNPDAKYELRKILGQLQGVATIEINPLTGSLLVNYNPKTIKPSDITEELQKKVYFDASKALTNDQYIQNAASKAGSFLGKTLLGSAIDSALEGSALSLLTIFI